MTNVSKRPLPKNSFDSLFSDLAKAVAGLNQGKQNQFWGGLLSESEKIMLTKRFAAVALLHKQCTYYRVARTLDISNSTARRIYQDYSCGNYDDVVLILKSKSFDNEKFWRTLEIILRGGMPSRGKDRWKTMRPQ